MSNYMEQGLSWPATEDEGEAAIPGTWLAIGTNPKGLRFFFFLSGGIFTCQTWHCAFGSFGAAKQLEKRLRGQIVGVGRAIKKSVKIVVDTTSMRMAGLDKTQLLPGPC